MTIVALHRSLLQCLTSASLCALIFINLCKNASFCSEIVDKLHSRRRYFLGSVWACLQCIISCYYGNYRKVVTKRLKSIFLKKIESSASWLLFLILLLCIFRINQQKIWLNICKCWIFVIMVLLEKDIRLSFDIMYDFNVADCRLLMGVKLFCPHFDVLH